MFGNSLPYQQLIEYAHEMTVDLIVLQSWVTRRQQDLSVYHIIERANVATVG